MRADFCIPKLFLLLIAIHLSAEVPSAALADGKIYDLVLKGGRVIDPESQLDAVRDEIRGLGVNCWAKVADVAKKKHVKAFVDGTADKLGGLDIVVANAGVVRVTNPAKDDFSKAVDDFEFMMDVNLRGVVNGIHAAYPIMLEQGFGHIVSTASMASHSNSS